ncbi:MAG: universal stress protein [Bacteroidales bacterium]|nr:universal stress protein [Bacteroidales bacterium]
MEDRLITVAIHTYDHAVALKALLESEGIVVALQNVNLAHPVVASGVRVRIRERDLPLALRIIENIEIISPAQSPDKTGATSHKVLVPIDFSPHSTRAVYLAFHLAEQHKASIVLVHSFIDPYITDSMQLTDTLSYDVEETQEHITIEKEAQRQMRQFADRLRSKIKDGSLPPVKFTTEVVDGLPEDVINAMAKQIKPLLIVMGTRGAGKKQRELVGSVTAEVLDSCRWPVFTVPESVTLEASHEIRRVAFFASLEQTDLLALDLIYRLFGQEPLQVTLVYVPKRKTLESAASLETRLTGLLDYCRTHYPAYDFKAERLTLGNVEADFDQLIAREPIDLIAVPNKKKNVLARLFNPGIAHRLLFRSDIPMIVIPV